MTLTGSHFTGATAVAFNGTAASYTVNSDTQITTTVPSGATSGPVSVTGPGGKATSSSSFTVTVSAPAPVISSFAPTSGVVGTSVTLTGSHFTGATAVAFNGTAASYTVNSDTQITTTVPSGATSGPVSVTGPGGKATSSSSFTVTVSAPAPVISSFAPTSGVVGTSVTLTGSHFTGATAVAFNGTAASYTVNSDTQITTTVPSGATSGPVSVTGPGGKATSSSAFTVTTGGGSGSTYYVSTSGSDANPCSQAKPCATFGKAYQVASPGDSVLVASGSYPKETVTWPNAKPAGSSCKWGAPFPSDPVAQDLSGCITFKPATPGGVTVSGVSISAPYVRLDGITTTGGVNIGWDGNAAGGNCDQQRSHDEVLSNMVDTGGIGVYGSSNVYIVNTDASGTDAGWQVQPCDPAGVNGQGAYVNTDHVALVGDTLHDIITNNQSGHTEGIHWQDTNYGYVGQSRFINDDQQDISFHVRSNSDRLNNLLLENNVFDAPCSNHSGVPQCQNVGGIGVLTWGCNSGPTATMHNVIVRFNSYQGQDTFDGIYPAGCITVQSYGNIMNGPPNAYACTNTPSGFVYSYNVFTNNGVQCGTGNTVNNPIGSVYTNPYPPAYDYTEKSGSPSINVYPLLQPFPTADILGSLRPLGAAPDAGAYEH